MTLLIRTFASVLVSTAHDFQDVIAALDYSVSVCKLANGRQLKRIASDLLRLLCSSEHVGVCFLKQ